MPKDIRRCVECNNDFKVWPSNAKIHCSLRCYQKKQSRICSGPDRPSYLRKKRTGIETSCLMCGKLTYRKDSEHAAKYCSRNCANLAMVKVPVIKTCKFCHKDFSRKPSQSVRIYCDQNCYMKAKCLKYVHLDRLHNGKQVRRDPDGYLWIYEPDYSPSVHGWMMEHRWVVGVSVGRKLLRTEHVHHVNGRKDDNRLENLELLDPSVHSSITGKEIHRRLKINLAELEQYRRQYGPLNKELQE